MFSNPSVPLPGTASPARPPCPTRSTLRPGRQGICLEEGTPSLVWVVRTCSASSVTGDPGQESGCPPHLQIQAGSLEEGAVGICSRKAGRGLWMDGWGVGWGGKNWSRPVCWMWLRHGVRTGPWARLSWAVGNLPRLLGDPEPEAPEQGDRRAARGAARTPHPGPRADLHGHLLLDPRLPSPLFWV